MIYLYWTLGILAWLVIGLLSWRMPYNDYAGGHVAMVAHNMPVFGSVLFIISTLLWPLGPAASIVASVIVAPFSWLYEKIDEKVRK